MMANLHFRRGDVLLVRYDHRMSQPELHHMAEMMELAKCNGQTVLFGLQSKGVWIS